MQSYHAFPSRSQAKRADVHAIQQSRKAAGARSNTIPVVARPGSCASPATGQERGVSAVSGACQVPSTDSRRISRGGALPVLPACTAPTSSYVTALPPATRRDVSHVHAARPLQHTHPFPEPRQPAPVETTASRRPASIAAGVELGEAHSNGVRGAMRTSRTDNGRVGTPRDARGRSQVRDRVCLRLFAHMWVCLCRARK